MLALLISSLNTENVLKKFRIIQRQLFKVEYMYVEHGWITIAQYAVQNLWHVRARAVSFGEASILPKGNFVNKYLKE